MVNDEHIQLRLLLDQHQSQLLPERVEEIGRRIDFAFGQRFGMRAALRRTTGVLEGEVVIPFETGAVDHFPQREVAGINLPADLAERPR